MKVFYQSILPQVLTSAHKCAQVSTSVHKCLQVSTSVVFSIMDESWTDLLILNMLNYATRPAAPAYRNTARP